MHTTIKIEEQREPYWKLGAIMSAGLAVILFVIYWNMSDVFWSGMVRLASFVSFAAAVMSGLKAMEGNLSIEVQNTGKALTFTYLKKGKNIKEESHELGNIESISQVQSPSSLSFRQGNVFIIRFKDSGRDYNLFHFSGRSLKIGSANTDRLIRFFKEQDIPFDSQK